VGLEAVVGPGLDGDSDALDVALCVSHLALCVSHLALCVSHLALCLSHLALCVSHLAVCVSSGSCGSLSVSHVALMWLRPAPPPLFSTPTPTGPPALPEG
jgi:hypothetical protein